jgi:hypothetical protein
MLAIATTRPLKYGDRSLSKSPDSLASLQGRQIPITDEHDGSVIGSVKNLVYKVVGGIGYLMGVPDVQRTGYGYSLQYKGSLYGTQIKFKPSDVDHLALTKTPRDTATMISDSNMGILFRDSETSETIVPEPTKDPEPNSDPAPATDPEPNSNSETEVEVDEETLAKVVEAILGKPEILDLLVNSLSGRPGAVTEDAVLPPDQQPTPTQTPTQPKTRLIVKPKTPQTTTPILAPRPIQQPFKAL